MTTLLVGKDYIAADRQVMLNGLAYEDAKIYVVNNRLAYFFGPNHPTEQERKTISKMAYALMFGNANSKAKATEWFVDNIRSNEMYIMTAKRTVKVDTIGGRLGGWNPEAGAPMSVTSKTLQISDLELHTPIGFGSGGDLAICGWACGLSPEQTLIVVQKLDTMSGKGYNIVYKKDLKA